MNNRRRLKLAPEILVHMFQPDPMPRYYAITKNALPADAMIVGVSSERSEDNMVIILEIESQWFTEDIPDPLPPVEITQLIAIVGVGVINTQPPTYVVDAGKEE